MFGTALMTYMKKWKVNNMRIELDNEMQDFVTEITIEEANKQYNEHGIGFECGDGKVKTLIV